MTSSFDIHIFGDGSGETILLQFDEGKIGIVDFGYKDFIVWFDSYLKSLKQPKIEFLLWTHPHDDHTRYLPDLLDYLKNKNLKIQNFFRFPFKYLRKLSEIMDIATEQKYDFLTNSPYAYVNRTKPKYLTALCEKISALKKEQFIINSSFIEFLSELYPNNVLQEDLSIHCIAPTTEDIDKYFEIYDNVLKNFETGTLYPDSQYHNIISTAINIKFGDSNIILGGDVENAAWSNAMKMERGKVYTHSNLLFLKAPHHGSETAYSKENWSNWGKDFHTAITPYNKSGLPKTTGIQNIMNHTTKIYVLKDIHKNLLLGENIRLMAGNLKAQDEITKATVATSHIKFTLSNNGDIEPSWL